MPVMRVVCDQVGKKLSWLKGANRQAIISRCPFISPDGVAQPLEILDRAKHRKQKSHPKVAFSLEKSPLAGGTGGIRTLDEALHPILP